MLIRLAAALLALLFASGANAQARTRIEKAADLPRFTYAVTGNLEQLVRDEAQFKPFAAQLRRDFESVLAQYDIADKSAERQLLGVLLQLDVLEGRDDAALARIEAIRALQEKPADRLLTGLLPRAIVESRKAAGGSDADAYRHGVGQRISDTLKPMPNAIIANGIREAKASAELVGEALVLGNVRDVLQPIVDKAGALSSDLAPGIVSARYALLMRLPLKQTLIETYGAYLAANKIDKPDIWAARKVDLPLGLKFAPVTIAVWDSGVDSALFGTQVVRDAAGKPRLIAFDKYSNPATGELMPIPPALKSKLATMKARTKGFSDLQSNIDSPEASELKQFLSTLKPDQYKEAVEEIGLSGNYEHGTHVAGIALEGNPYARLLIARLEFGYTLMPDPCPSRAQAEKDARAMTAYVDFLKRNKVRVVNMSWGGSVRAIESDLEQCGIGKTPAERKALAREYFDLGRKAMTKAFASAPAILFITAAGNSNEDATFAEDAPADIVLPNLLTVGAVDQAGDEASFTSYGKTVKVHANGYQVESFLPGGDRVALSGTSMAAPQVANLAGKMLAVNPRLKPAEMIDIIVKTSEKTADGRRVLVHPANAVAAAAGKRG
jgi:hypothetical protein